MDRFNALGRGTQLMLIGAVLLLIDLFLPLAGVTYGPARLLRRQWRRWHGF